MSVATKHAALHALIEPVVAAMGFELWGIDHLSQGKHSRLVIYIERESGVSVEDCADISRQVSAVMDVEDPIPGEYRLEVSSPGMARPLYTLDQFIRYQGHHVALKLRVAFDGRRKYQGLLAGVEGDEVLLQLDGEEYCFPIESIDSAHVVPQFDE
nr:ribosome maturation factor RimP [Halomonas sp. IOP_6]